MLKRILLLAIFLSFAYASTLLAAVPALMNYQGILTNGSGSPLVSTSRSVQFTIYDAAVAGAVQWAETLTVNTDASGRFNTILGQVHPLTDGVFSGTDRYLGLTVASDPELAPRSRIVSVGYANRVSTVDGATGGTITGNVTLNSTLTADVIEAGDATTAGTVLAQNGNGTTGATMTGNGDGGRILLQDETSAWTHYLTPGFFGDGGSLVVYGDQTFSSGVEIDGDASGTDDPQFFMLGSSQTAVIDLGSTGNASVSLPADGISSPEILDEPGVAGNSFDGFAPGVSIAPMLSRTITSPAAGYVLAVASCEWDGFHTAGTTSHNWAGLSSSSSTIPGDQELQVFISSALPSAEYLEQLASVEIFPVPAGAFTVYYNCVHLTGATGAFYDINLELVYLPTTYGTVLASAQADLPVTASTGTPNQVVAATPTVSSETERVQSMADNNARIEKELATMKAQLEKLQAQFKEQAEKGRLGAPKLEQKQ